MAAVCCEQTPQPLDDRRSGVGKMSGLAAVTARHARVTADTHERNMQAVQRDNMYTWRRYAMSERLLTVQKTAWT